MTAPPARAVPPPAFRAASRHHHDTAQLAAKQRLHISADHLAGLAAECAIKAILLDYLGSRLNDKLRPFSPDLVAPAVQNSAGEKPKKQDRKEYMHEHLPELWGQLATVAQRRIGRSAPQFMALISRNPFDDWDVAGRYCDGTTITQSDLARHLQAAYDLLAAHEQARILGTGTLA
ncbi:hypothetical protein [Streptomyces sp. NPDC056524]|uniref:hypothetical protein n=1 Tax=Streptomyces sp. NPDC056524 TaxID=3345851 RepID=UPI0036782E72